MRRFLPYLRYLRGRRITLVLALICGGISGLVFGFGLPKVIHEVFPRIFTGAEGEPAQDTSVKGARLVPNLNSVDTPAVTPEERIAAAERIKAGRTLTPIQVLGYALL